MSANHRGLLADAVHRLRDAEARIAAAERRNAEPIAILGMGMRLAPDVADPDAFWELLARGGDAIRDGHERTGGRPAGLLDDIVGFDARFFGISAAEASRMDPQHRLVLEVAWEAAEDGEVTVEELRERATGVFLGIYAIDYLTLQTDAHSIDAYTAPGSAHSIAANRLSYLLDLHGPSLAVDTACSSSLVAVHLACQALRAGDCDLALAGGVNVMSAQISTTLTGKVLPLAPGGRCRTFDAAADGIVRGEGCGMVLLQRASEIAPPRTPRAVIRGTAVNQDGRTNGLTAPSPLAQRALIEQALDRAGVAGGDIAYAEAHGTGTPLGDPIEIEALGEALALGRTAPCVIGSVKTNLGHLEAAAGIAGLMKAVLVLEHDEAPPHLHLHELNPEIRTDGTGLHLAAKRTALRGERTPRLAAVSSFGFGGTNAHAIIEGPSAPAPGVTASSDTGRVLGELVLPLSARSDEALSALELAYADRLFGADDEEAAAVCAAAAVGRTHHQASRRCVHADRAEGVRRELELAARRTPRTAATASAGVAFIFSGQGSQWPGMGLALAEREPAFGEEMAACAAEIDRLAGWSLTAALAAPADESRLADTAVAQLAIAAVQLGLAALLRSWGVVPRAVAGHSMGEVVAAHVTGALSRGDALELLLLRARLLERARGGAMASLRTSEDEARTLIDAAADGPSGIAAVNGPSSIVVSGERAAVGRVVDAAASRGVRAKLVPVDYAFHSALLDGCDAELAAAARHLHAREPRIELYSTVTGERLHAADLKPAYWGRNLREPVRMAAAVTAMARHGIGTCVELSPHPVIVADLAETLGERGTAIATLRRDAEPGPPLAATLSALYEAGAPIGWPKVVGNPPRRVTLPHYPWQRRRHWLGTPDAGTREPRPTAPPAPRIDPEALAVVIRERIAAALEVDDVGSVALDEPLESLGLTSLMVVEIKNQLEVELGLAVPLTVLLEGGTPREVAAKVCDAQPGSTKVEALTDAEVEEALARLLSQGGRDA